jgi:hypothetical protein
MFTVGFWGIGSIEVKLTRCRHVGEVNRIISEVIQELSEA